MDIKTRSGLKSTQKEIPYVISTSEAEEYLQGKINIAMKGNDEVSVNLLTLQAGNKFAPFIAYFPESVCKREKNYNNRNELSVFSGNSSNKIDLDDRIYAVIRPYIYNKDDENAFFSNEWRRRCGVPASNSAMLKSCRKPHISKFNNGKLTVVGVLIDPVRLFHDMLTSDNFEEAKRERFYVYIDGITKVSNSQFSYKVTRERANTGSKKNKNITDVLSAELARKMRR